MIWSTILKLETIFHWIVFFFHVGFLARPKHLRTATEEMGARWSFREVADSSDRGRINGFQAGFLPSFGTKHRGQHQLFENPHS